MRYTLTTPPTVEPVTLNEVKSHLRLETADSIYEEERDLLLALIKTAREQAEEHTRRAFLTQTWTVHFDNWPGDDFICLPYPPLISTTHIKHTDPDGVQSTFTDYSTDTGTPGRIVLDDGYTWPTDTLRPRSPIEIQFVAGYGATAASVPASIKQAILLMIGHLYENRDRIAYTSVSEIPFAVDSLLASYRWRS